MGETPYNKKWRKSIVSIVIAVVYSQPQQSLQAWLVVTYQTADSWGLHWIYWIYQIDPSPFHLGVSIVMGYPHITSISRWDFHGSSVLFSSSSYWRLPPWLIMETPMAWSPRFFLVAESHVMSCSYVLCFFYHGDLDFLSNILCSSRDPPRNNEQPWRIT